MHSNWPFDNIGTHAEVFSGFAFKSTDLTECGEIPVVKIKNVNNGSVDIKDTQFFASELLTDKHSKHLLKNGDVLIAMTGQGSVGRIGRVRIPRDKVILLNQRVGKFIPKPSLDIGYLYYVCSASYYEEIFFNAAIGSGQPNLSPNDIKKIKIPIPPLIVQKHIAHILGTLDDKIELNRQMNTTLESMAQALFKSWFVDFDPVIDNALAAGNPIPEPLQARAEVRQALGDKRKPLPEAIQQQFPDQFVFTEQMGWVPEGWSISCIKDIGSVVTGKTPPKSVEAAFSVSGVPFLTPSDIDGSVFAVSTDRSLTAEGVASVRKSLIPAWSICVTCIGSQMGKTVINPFEATTNQQINSIKVNDEPVLYWLFLLLRGMRDELLLLGSSGSTMPIVNKSTFESVQLLRPSHPVLHYFSHQVAPILQKVLHSTENMKSLGEIRDTLLLKLLSGELRIPDAEKLVAEIG